MSQAAIYLGHFNPLTNSHVNIISNLKKRFKVYVFPVVFLDGNVEVNTRSFPFSFDIRKKMIESVFDENVKVLPNYRFESPYLKYIPYLVSPLSRRFKNQVLRGITEEQFVSYTGDTSERVMLLIHGFHPLSSKRIQISSSCVKELLYANILNFNKRVDDSWKRFVPIEVASIIMENWSIVEKYAVSEDETIRIFGMKIPKSGLF